MCARRNVRVAGGGTTNRPPLLTIPEKNHRPSPPAYGALGRTGASIEATRHPTIKNKYGKKQNNIKETLNMHCDESAGKQPGEYHRLETERPENQPQARPSAVTGLWSTV